MKIKTITCHDVYNVGASLQAYALSTYLKNLGNEVEIIDYKPIYLRHYRLTGIGNPVYNKPVIKQIYNIVKFPGRVCARYFEKRKKLFDAFTREFLPVTKKTYPDYETLVKEPPEADVYIAGSDQIWNPVFQNGKDPAFMLGFVPNGKKKISYAASFSVDKLSEDDKTRMKPLLEGMDEISVREKSGVRLLEEMGLSGINVLDPVFLLEKEKWLEIAETPAESDYIFVYDFDGNDNIKAMAKKLAKESGRKIVSVFPNDYADEVWYNMGPLGFLGAVNSAGIVLSNSFHATAFSLIFQKDFYVAERQEKINTRMRDLLGEVELSERLVACEDDVSCNPISWERPSELLSNMVCESKSFLKKHCE